MLSKEYTLIVKQTKRRHSNVWPIRTSEAMPEVD